MAKTSITEPDQPKRTEKCTTLKRLFVSRDNIWGNICFFCRTGMREIYPTKAQVLEDSQSQRSHLIEVMLLLFLSRLFVCVTRGVY